MSRPATSTRPELGLSSPPRICNSVVLPEPEAPTMATRSPAAICKLAPASTFSISGPCRKLLQTSMACSAASLMSQGLRRRGAGGSPGRVQRGQDTQGESHGTDPHHIDRLNICRQITHVVYAGIQEMRAEQMFQAMDPVLQIMGHHDAERCAQHR